MFSFFHVCDHSWNFKDQKLNEQRIKIKGPMKDIRRITKGAIITDIVGVIVHKQLDFQKIDSIDYDKRERFDNTSETKGYYDENHESLVDFSEWIESGEYIPKEYYEKYLHNRIKWLVRPPLEYTVVANVIIQGDFKTTVDPDDCDRCQGNGWYVDITDNKQIFSKSNGAYKVLQNIIKDLLTKIGSSRLSGEYGQRLHLLPAEHYDEEVLYEDIRLEVLEVESNYILRQQEVINQLPNSEILTNLEVVRLVRSKSDPTKVALVLRIVTEEEDRIYNLKV